MAACGRFLYDALAAQLYPLGVACHVVIEMLPTLVLASWSAFQSQLEQLGCGSPTRTSHVFRGQADALWSLEPSLRRVLQGTNNAEAAARLEDDLENEFFSQAHLYSPFAQSIRDADSLWLERLALMQHHGAPTRLLDWTSSPMAAAYFACVAQSASDGAIFVAHPLTVGSRTKKRLGVELSAEKLAELDESGTVVVNFFKSSFRSDRQVTQQGHFSVATNALAAHDEMLIRALEPGEGASGSNVVAAKWIIPQGMKLMFLNQLRQLNVAGHSLFPGLDGIGRSLIEAAIIEGALLKRNVNSRDDG
jgi:hypothetical protein